MKQDWGNLELVEPKQKYSENLHSFHYLLLENLRHGRADWADCHTGLEWCSHSTRISQPNEDGPFHREAFGPWSLAALRSLLLLAPDMAASDIHSIPEFTTITTSNTTCYKKFNPNQNKNLKLKKFSCLQIIPQRIWVFYKLGWQLPCKNMVDSVD